MEKNFWSNELQRKQTVIALSSDCEAYFIEWKHFKRSVQKFITPQMIQQILGSER